MIKGFRTYELAVALYQACEHIDARYYLKDQLLRASLSIVLNLAEGSAKPTPKDRQRFYAIALGSLRETQSILTILGKTQELELADLVGAHLYRLTHPRTQILTQTPGS